MSITERVYPEHDILTWPRRGIERKIIFSWRAKCPQATCNMMAVFLTREDAEYALSTHVHGTAYNPELAGFAPAEAAWLELDRIIDTIKVMAAEDKTFVAQYPTLNGPNESDLLKLQGRAGGLAFMVMTTSGEDYPSEKEVSREALERWKMRQHQIPWRQTPGYRYNPPTPHMTSSQTSATRAAKASQAPAIKAAIPETVLAAKASVVPEETKVAIRTAVGSGMFQPANLVGLYSLPEEVIKYIAESS